MIITIRQATQGDYGELMVLYNKFAEKNLYSQHDHDSFKEVLKNTSNHMYVAEDAGKIIGFAFFSTRFVVRYPKHIMQLEELFVLDSYRKQGVGGRLMEVMEEKAKDLDCYNIYIESSMKRKEAHKFYEDLGYKKSGYYFKKE